MSKRILLVGNPNVGKSTIFNELCNLNQKTGNYAGVTVASHSGTYIFKGEKVEVTDLPGAYSIYPSSEDEAVFSKYITEDSVNYQGIIYIADALNMRRSLLLFQQIRDLGLPIIMVVNQIDIAKKRGLTIDTLKLENLLGVKVITTNAKRSEGIENLKQQIFDNEFSVSNQVSFDIPTEQKALVFKLKSQLGQENDYKIWTLLAADKYLGKLESIAEQLTQETVKCLVPKRLQVQETTRRYKDIDKILPQILYKEPTAKELFTEKLDKVLVHPIWGYVVFGLLLLFIFNSVFYLAEYPMGWIEDGMEFFGGWVEEILPEGPLSNLIINGVIPGIASVLPFVPQIGILLYFLYLLEDTGYMARVVFLTDRFLKPFGLNGKSIVPLVSSTACAVPAVMAARNIENVKERLLTILVTPFMACSARLPIYSIIIGLVIPDEYFLGIISYRALMLMLMYFLGFFMALMASLILKKIIKSHYKSFLVMDLPAYKVPLWGYNFKIMLGKIWDFITGSGKIIFSVSVLLWALAYFGPRQNSDEIISANVELEDSYLTIVGKVIQPVVEPLGYDWKMGVGLLTSFAARETFVGTLGVLYNLEDDPQTEADESDPEGDEGGLLLIDKMKADTKPNGEKVFIFATGMSILMFYAFAMQCISTIAIVYKETKSLKWTMVQLVSMTGLAYISAFLVYQFFR